VIETIVRYYKWKKRSRDIFSNRFPLFYREFFYLKTPELFCSWVISHSTSHIRIKIS